MKKIFLHVLTFTLVSFPVALKAEEGSLRNPLAFNTLYDFLNGILELVILIGFPIIVLFIVWIGFNFVQTSASGDAEGLKKVKKNFWYAILGALILLGAQALSFAIEATVENLSEGIR